MSKSSSWPAAQAATPFRALVLQLLAAVLRAASEALTRLAERTSERAAERAAESAISVGTVEFHALYRDAGAPEGAIYVDGKLVGVIPGITRL